MKHFSLWSGLLLALTLIDISIADAGVATCVIEIQDVIKGNNYTLEHRFFFEKGHEKGAQRKHFETPGNDYVCTLAFFELKNGTMLSCEYKKDMGWTYFQSDRSVLKDDPVTNNLSFRHKSSQIYIKTRCE